MNNIVTKYPKNYIIEASTFDGSLSIITAQDNDKIEVFISGGNLKNKEKLDESGYVNLANTEYKGLIKTFLFKDFNDFKSAVDSSFSGNPENINARKLRDELDKIRDIAPFEAKLDGGNLLKTYIPEFTIYEREAVSIKIPTYFTWEDGARWDYDYLLYPLSDLSDDTVSFNPEMVKAFNKYIDFEPVVDLSEDCFMTNFSVNRYRIKQYEYMLAAIRTKSIINYIRAHEDELVYNEYYSLYQSSRMAKTDKMGSVRINWIDSLTSEVTFPKAVGNILGISIEELNAIPIPDFEESMNKVKEMVRESDTLSGLSKERNLETLDAIHEYKMLEDMNSAMHKYEQYEIEREKIRYDLFFMNLGMRNHIEHIIKFYNKTANSNISNLTELDFGNNMDKLMIKFQRKMNVISDSGELDVEWDKETVVF